MAGDFSPITFFQRTPNALLGRYFQEKHGVLAEIAFDELEENSQTAEAIFQAFSDLSERKLKQIEAECQEIEAMTHQAGGTALIEFLALPLTGKRPDALLSAIRHKGCSLMVINRDQMQQMSGAIQNPLEKISCPIVLAA